MAKNKKKDKDKKKKEKGSDIYDFKDPTGRISSRGLVIGEWFVKHRIILRNIGLTALATFCVLTVGYSFYIWGDYAIFGYWQDRDQLAEQADLIQNYTNIQNLYSPAEVRIANTQVYTGVNNKYDFVAEATNPNENWYAILTYNFTYSTGETEERRVPLMPFSQIPIGVFGHKSDNFPTNAGFVLNNITWKRVNPHKITNPVEYKNQRLSFSFDNFEFTRAQREGGGLPVNRVEFDLYNDSAYSYWEPSFYIELLSGNQTIGIVPLIVPEFRAGEQRHIDFRTFVQTTNISDIVVHPVINIFDESVYMDPEG